MITKIYCKQCSPHDPTMAIMRCRCLCAKLSFLHRICSSESDTLCSEVYKTLTYPDIESISLVKQCRLLELPYSSNFTSEILTNPTICMRSLKKRVIQIDRTLQLNQAKDHPSQSIVAQVVGSVGWMKVWDAALDRGPGGTVASLSVLKLLCKTVFADRKCPVEPCNIVVPPDCALCEHFLAQHTDLKSNTKSLFDLICVCSEELFTSGHNLSKFV